MAVPRWPPSSSVPGGASFVLGNPLQRSGIELIRNVKYVFIGVKKICFQGSREKVNLLPFNSMILKVLELLLEQWLLCSSRAVEGSLHPPLHPLVLAKGRLVSFEKHKTFLFYLRGKKNCIQYEM